MFRNFKVHITIIYTRLIVYAILNLTYSKEYILNMLYDIIVLKHSTSFLCDIWLYDIILTSNSKFKIRKINKNKNKKEVKINGVHHL